MTTRVLMIAAENDGLQKVDGRGGKVGGIADVVRDIPPALAEEGCEVTVVVPSYGCLHRVAGSRLGGHAEVSSAATASVYEVPGREPHPGVRNLIVDHPRFVSRDDDGGYEIYHDDPPETPFASDATKFAFFCRAVAAALEERVIARPDCLHLHDWHGAFLLLLRQFDPGFPVLKEIPWTVYTIHNLGLQGVRPLRGHPSSLERWYPGLAYDLEQVIDPRWQDCVNPMAVGIRLADRVHAVSPSYAQEILEPSDPARDYYGGEGLDGLLRQADGEGRLVGILNGVEYPPAVGDREPEPGKLAVRDVAAKLAAEVGAAGSASKSVAARVALPHRRLRDLGSGSDPAAVLLTSVTRLTDQKVKLLLAKTGPAPGARSALEEILDLLREHHGVYVLLGTGWPAYEGFLAGLAARYDRFIFLNYFSIDVAEDLYAHGDLFLMPSSFEPCGISQMLAMRRGQPCLVHAVGGLRDTVEDGETGFCFTGDSLAEKAAALVERCRDALEVRRRDRDRWQAIRDRAAAERFRWRKSARRYVRQLYRA